MRGSLRGFCFQDKRSFISKISSLMQGQMDLHQKINSLGILDWYRFIFKSMIFANNGNLNFDSEVAPSWKIPGNFSFGGGPFDLASNWKFPGIFPFGTRTKIQIPSKTKVCPSKGSERATDEVFTSISRAQTSMLEQSYWTNSEWMLTFSGQGLKSMQILRKIN